MLIFFCINDLKLFPINTDGNRVNACVLFFNFPNGLKLVCRARCCISSTRLRLRKCISTFPISLPPLNSQDIRNPISKCQVAVAKARLGEGFSHGSVMKLKKKRKREIQFQTIGFKIYWFFFKPWCFFFQVPKAGENFIKLCKKGYYDGTIFHRSIRNFMVRNGIENGPLVSLMYFGFQSLNHAGFCGGEKKKKVFLCSHDAS